LANSNEIAGSCNLSQVEVTLYQILPRLWSKRHSAVPHLLLQRTIHHVPPEYLVPIYLDVKILDPGSLERPETRPTLELPHPDSG